MGAGTSDRATPAITKAMMIVAARDFNVRSIGVLLSKRLPALVRLLLQRVANGLARLPERGLGARNILDAIQQHEIMNLSFVTCGSHAYAGFLELSRVGFAFIAQRVVFSCNHQRGWQSPELFEACAHGHGIWVFPGHFVRGIDVPAELHERPWQKAAALKVIVGLGRKVGVGCRNKKDLQTDFGPAAIS